MSRLARVVAVGTAHHITQRGNARRAVFETDSDRLAYLSLIAEFSRISKLSILGYCLMPNHVHLVGVPERPDSMPSALRYANGRYAAYLNARQGATGHVWQGRYYSCPMDEIHLWEALRYVELNPVRAGMVDRAEDYPWSSARLHCEGPPRDGFIDLAAWHGRWTPYGWQVFLANADAAPNRCAEIRHSTHTGRPLGSPEFVRGLEHSLERILVPRKAGRPRQVAAEIAERLQVFTG